MILSEDETKVKGKVARDHRRNTFEGFCVPKDDYACVSNYKIVLGMRGSTYNNIADAFRTNFVEILAEIIMINPLYSNLLQLVLIIICTCNYLDASWVNQQ